MSGRLISERVARTPILFGTDGWRAVIAHEFTFANLERVAQAYADFINGSQQDAQQQATRAHEATPHVVVGYDRRFLSEKFAD
jgi:phosphomannomutase